MEKKEVPVLLLTGYLGSGKTTLVNHILANEEGIKFAVIVNDIGEVNIDADLIQKEGIVGKKDDSLVSLQNGCICCTLKMNLIDQILDLMRMERFDYIVIEASGVCEPEPIAQTICSIPSMGFHFTRHGICRLDCIVTVVDALRLQSEFGSGSALTEKKLGEEDIENLIIQQIEFCNIILLNKASEVKFEDLEHMKAIIHTLQPSAEIIECDYAHVELDKIIHTHVFDFNKAVTSAAWVHELERPLTDEEKAEAEAHDEEDEHHHEEDDHDEHEHHHEHCHHHDHDEDDHDEDEDEDDHDDHGHEHHHEEGHCHHHHHEHEGGEVEEYGIGTYVYYRRPAFNMNKFDYFIAKKWPKNVIRAKGLCYFSDNINQCYLFEQAGVQKKLSDAGLFYAAAPEDELKQMMEQDATLVRDWDEKYGDRMQKLVFIGQHLDKEQIAHDLDLCLEDEN